MLYESQPPDGFEHRDIHLNQNAVADPDKITVISEATQKPTCYFRKSRRSTIPIPEEAASLIQIHWTAANPNRW